jgi:ABC-type lipoprotein export system ATPase subunit
VLVSHDPLAAAYADAVYGLHDGTLSAHELDPAFAHLSAAGRSQLAAAGQPRLATAGD